MGTKNASPEAYTLDAELSRNEYVTLYQGRHTPTGTPVTIKVPDSLYSSDDLFARRFRQLIDQTSQLDHPHILRTHQTAAVDEQLCIIQDDPGLPALAQIIERDGPFSPQRMQHLAAQIASALDYAHQNGLFHGDLSARRVYVGPTDEVLVANFGHSQLFLGANLMKHGQSIASPETLAPERVQGQGPSRHADLYALGILCYQMLTGQPPFTGPASSVLHAQAHKQPLPPHLVDARIPIGVSQAIGRMVSKGMELRYNTGAEFIRALAMAKHNSRPIRRPEYLMPITEREQHSAVPFKTFFYGVITLMMIIFFSGLFGWAGYELALKQAEAQTASVRVVAAATIVALQTTPESNIIGSTRILSPTLETEPKTEPTPETGPATTPIEAVNSIADTLLPTRRPATASPTPSPSPTSTVAVVLPTPVPAIPASRPQFIFKNPTAFDVIVDLTGPAPVSQLIPPGQQHEFTLPPGEYQYMAHTLAGEALKPVVGRFTVILGETVEKDYYSDYDWTQE